MIKKAAVTLCAIVALAMPAIVKGIPFDVGVTLHTRIENYRIVKVKKGESLWRIAKREYGTGINYSTIASANGIKLPYIIYPNQELKIPQI